MSAFPTSQHWIQQIQCTHSTVNRKISSSWIPVSLHLLFLWGMWHGCMFLPQGTCSWNQTYSQDKCIMPMLTLQQKKVIWSGIIHGPLSETRLTRSLLEDVANDTSTRDNQGHPVAFLEATAFPNLAFTEHDGHHLLLWDRQSLQAFWVQIPLHLGREQAQNCTAVESSCRKPGSPPASWKEQLNSMSGVRKELITPASFIWTAQRAFIFGRNFANIENPGTETEKEQLSGCKYVPLSWQQLSCFKCLIKHCVHLKASSRSYVCTGKGLAGLTPSHGDTAAWRSLAGMRDGFSCEMVLSKHT